MRADTPVPSSYAATLASLKQHVRNARFIAHRRANTELVVLYGQIGATILLRQGQEGWGTKVIARLAEDLRTEFPEMRGFSAGRPRGRGPGRRARSLDGGDGA